MVDNENLSNRRRFLGRLATGAAALGATTLIDPLRLYAEAAPSASPSDEKSLEAWFGKLKGKAQTGF